MVMVSGRSIACSSGSDDFTYNPNSKALVVEGAITGASLKWWSYNWNWIIKNSQHFSSNKNLKILTPLDIFLLLMQMVHLE